MARVELDNLTKVYDDAQGTEVAVEELNVTFEDGEFVVILGPSGCGKSTTLRMMAGLEDITEGRVLIDDEDVTDKKPKDRDVALVFQNYALYPHKTVRQNIGYGLRIRSGLTDEEINERVEQTAQMMGIDDLLDKKPSALSGGQQQRVATGRAIVREPAVFLFDEPLSNLDAKLRKHLRTELARLHSQLGITSIYVTHNQEEAMTLGDKVLILDNGRVQQMATPLEIYHNPTNRFVADFIGSPSMNFFDVEVELTDDGGQLVHTDWTYVLSSEFVSNINMPDDRIDGKQFILGVRPEHLQIADDRASGRTIPVTVDVVETMGVDNYIYLEGDDEFIIRSSPEINPESGEALTITFDESDAVLFDVETEENVLRTKTRDVIEEQP
jgi:multiple sugar transport system ATP-binding protein